MSPKPSWWFTADLHFGHQAIIGHTGRPWKTVDDMDIALVDGWNMAVKPWDNVVVAGDFYFGSGKADDVRYRYIRHLNGNIIFVKGNHDHWIKRQEDKRYMWTKNIPFGETKVLVHVSHYPLRTWRRGAIQLHGHSHGDLEPYKNQLDVGVDNAAKLVGTYRPLSLHEVVAIIRLQNLSQHLKDSEDHLSISQVFNFNGGAL